MNLKDRITAFENDARILGRIASQYNETSIEYAALRRAAIALWHVSTTNYEAFTDYVAQFGGALRPEQRLHLRAIGIDPDHDPDWTEPVAGLPRALLHLAYRRCRAGRRS